MHKAYPDDLTDKEWEQNRLLNAQLIVMLGENPPILA